MEKFLEKNLFFNINKLSLFPQGQCTKFCKIAKCWCIGFSWKIYSLLAFKNRFFAKFNPTITCNNIVSEGSLPNIMISVIGSFVFFNKEWKCCQVNTTIRSWLKIIGN